MAVWSAEPVLLARLAIRPAVRSVSNARAATINCWQRSPSVMSACRVPIKPPPVNHAVATVIRAHSTLFELPQSVVSVQSADHSLKMASKTVLCAQPAITRTLRLSDSVWRVPVAPSTTAVDSVIACPAISAHSRECPAVPLVSSAVSVHSSVWLALLSVLCVKLELTSPSMVRRRVCRVPSDGLSRCRASRRVWRVHQESLLTTRMLSSVPIARRVRIRVSQAVWVACHVLQGLSSMCPVRVAVNCVQRVLPIPISDKLYV
jgi:hypothetical protein